jgi:hypothetical protein
MAVVLLRGRGRRDGPYYDTIHVVSVMTNESEACYPDSRTGSESFAMNYFGT